MPHTVLTIPEMSPQTARTIVGMLRDRAGIAIPHDKTDLLRNRLGRRLRDLGLEDFDSYGRLLASPAGAIEAVRMVEALTTHTTSFFREGRQYEWLAAVGLPDLVANRVGLERDLTLWSAACSTGAEIYSAAIVIAEFSRRRALSLRWRGLGTDISRQILARAETGVFTEVEIAGIPEALRPTSLLRGRAGGPQSRDGTPLYRIVPELRTRISFAQANLMALDDGPTIAADLVFLRNVLIYFERADQDRIVSGVVRRLRPGGYLLTGHAEALPAPPPGMIAIESSIYRKDA